MCPSWTHATPLETVTHEMATNDQAAARACCASGIWSPLCVSQLGHSTVGCRLRMAWIPQATSIVSIMDTNADGDRAPSNQMAGHSGPCQSWTRQPGGMLTPKSWPRSAQCAQGVHRSTGEKDSQPFVAFAAHRQVPQRLVLAHCFAPTRRPEKGPCRYVVNTPGPVLLAHISLL